MRSAILAVLPACAALAGCAGSASSGVSPDAYVRARCATLSAWKATVKHAGLEIQRVRPKTLAEGRQKYVRFVSELLRATQHAAAAMRAAGAPAVANGERISHNLVAAFDDAATALQHARALARTIPINGTTAYAKAAGALTASISQTMSKMGSVDPVTSSELQAAAAKAPACMSLVS